MGMDSFLLFKKFVRSTRLHKPRIGWSVVLCFVEIPRTEFKLKSLQTHADFFLIAI